MLGRSQAGDADSWEAQGRDAVCLHTAELRHWVAAQFHKVEVFVPDWVLHPDPDALAEYEWMAKGFFGLLLWALFCVAAYGDLHERVSDRVDRMRVRFKGD